MMIYFQQKTWKKYIDIIFQNKIGIWIFFISFSYMITWTSLASLIPYYKKRYGSQFYIELTSAFYLPGLPIAIIDTMFGEKFDVFLTSRNSYLGRGIACYCVLNLVLICSCFFDSRSFVKACFALIGISTWTLHMSATTVVSLFPKSHLLFLQIGFRIPEFYALIMVAMLTLTSNASKTHLHIFYSITGLMCTIGMLGWIQLVTHEKSIFLLDMKDNKALFQNKHEEVPLLKSNFGASKNHNVIDYQSIDEESDTVSKRNVYSYVDIFWKVYPYCLALFITLFSSILTASFFGYIKSPNGWDISQIMYFTRLFCDLMGRPLTLVLRPRFVTVGR